MESSQKSVSEILAGCFARSKKDFHYNPLFVFPTAIQMQSWIDWAVRFSEESGVKAVNADQFTVWDNFKSEFVQSVDETCNGSVCVPALMRKVFVQDLLRRNNQQKFLAKIIANQADSAETAFGFTDWLAKILPSLRLWEKHHIEDFLKNGNSDDGENRDFHLVYEEYCRFLNKNHFYEPAYLDIAYKAKNRQVFIFYPEILEDFAEYSAEFEKFDDVTLVNLPDSENEQTTDCVLYPDARMELRRLCLQIRKLQKEGADLRRVAVNVPKLSEVRPNIEREFRLYGIPFIVRDGLSCTKNCGGDIFGKIQDCIKLNFSFETVRALLCDGFVPWKNPELNRRLIQYGLDLRCLCSEESDASSDVWIMSMEKALASFYSEMTEFSSNLNEALLYYRDLRAAVLSFDSCRSFSELQQAWFNFRDCGKFLEPEKFVTDPTFDVTNKILGKVLTDLSEMVRLEKNYIKESGALNNYLDFFINEINQETYNPNEKKYGVNIFTYRVASGADFDHMFVIDASQADITVPMKQLSFIKDERKRELFGLAAGDADGSARFIKLYGTQQRAGTAKKVYFSCSEKNFDGAAIMHTALHQVPAENYAFLDEYDFVTKQKESMLFRKGFDEFTASQKEAFENWQRISDGSGTDQFSDDLESAVRNAFKLDKNDVPLFSASALNCFFDCPTKFLYQNVLRLQEESVSPRIARANEVGTLVHKLVELLFGELAETDSQGRRKLPLLDRSSAEDRAKVREAFDKVWLLAIQEVPLRSLPKNSSLAMNVLQSQRPGIEGKLVDFMLQICAFTAEDLRGKKEQTGFGGYFVAGTEIRVPPVKNQSPEKTGFGLFGSIDCLLCRETFDEDGNPVLLGTVIDYKTGKTPSASECVATKDGTADSVLKNFQIAAYVHLAESMFPKLKVESALFYSLKEKKDNLFSRVYVFPNDRNSVKTREDFQPTVESLFDYASFAADKIAVNDFSVSSDPAARNFVSKHNDCRNCQYKAICRTPFAVGNGR